jgi:AraC-like DNA-binding protein
MSEFIKNKLSTTISISEIVTILYYKFTKNFVFSGEKHDFWEFVYVDKGELIITSGEQKYILKSGELAFHKPNEFHDIRANGKISPNVIVVAFTSKSKYMDFYKNKILFLSDSEKKILTFIIEESEKAFDPIENIPPITGMTKKNNVYFGAEQLIKSEIEKLLICIYRRQDSIHIRQRCLRENQHQNYLKIAEKIIEILENNLGGKITLSSISNQINLSTSQAKKIFNEETGDSIINYYITLKIEEAKRLINGSTLNFTQISEVLGYENVGYFSRVFKQKTGMTPSEYSLSVKK